MEVSGTNKVMSVNEYTPQARDKLVNVVHLLHLVNKQLDVLHELLRSIVMEDVHVHHLTTASKERRTIVFLINERSDAGQDEGTRIYRLEIASGHL